MDRIASLRHAARELRASIFRSLPLGLRLAHILVEASSAADAFGRMISAIFLKAGVQGMPDPGPRWRPDSPRAADTLPPGYGRDFGESLLRTMIRKFRDVEFVEDSIMEFLADRALMGKLKIHEGAQLHSAQGLLFTAVTNFIIDKTRVEAGRKKLMPTRTMEHTDDEGKKVDLDIEDEKSMHEFAEHESDATVRAIKREIAKILPWAPQWFDMLMEDYKDTEIIGDPVKGKPSALAEQMGLEPPFLPAPSGKPMTIPMWSMNYKPKLMDKIKEVYAKS